MIHHIVQFEWKPDATAAQIDAAAAALLAMRSGIPDIRDIRFGPNLVEETVPFRHVLIVVCDDMDALRRYIAHPVHKEVVLTYMKPILQARVAADLDVGPTGVPDGH